MQVVLDSFESFVGVNLWTMLFAWLNLLIIYLFLRKFLFAPVKNMIDSRQKEIDDMYESAEKSKTDAESFRKEYEERLEKADSESEEILKKAHRKAQLREEEILKEAAAQAELIRKRGEEAVALERAHALNEIKNEVSDMAISIAAAVIERDINKDDHDAMIDDFINEIGEKK